MLGEVSTAMAQLRKNERLRSEEVLEAKEYLLCSPGRSVCRGSDHASCASSVSLSAEPSLSARSSAAVGLTSLLATEGGGSGPGSGAKAFGVDSSFTCLRTYDTDTGTETETDADTDAPCNTIYSMLCIA
eukprot:1754750-Rhodomonas_salina.7